MSLGYNLCEAARLEVMKLPFANNILGFTEKVDTTRLPGDDSDTGKKLGKAIREFGKWYSKLPGVMLVPDTITRSYCVDLLLSDLEQDKRHPLRLIQTAEAMVAADQLRRLVRIARTIDPVSSTFSEVVRKGAQLGTSDERPPVEKLIRAAYGVVMKETQGKKPTFMDHLTLSRVNRLYGKPGRAIWHGIAAAKLADAELEQSGYSEDDMSFGDRFLQGTKRVGWRSIIRVTGKLNEEEKDDDGCPYDVDAKYKWQLRKGAALTVVSWAYHDIGDDVRAEAYAHQALSETDFTCAKEVLATITKPDGGIFSRIITRSDEMDGIRAQDRVYYHGHWNGSLRIAGGIVGKEAGKIGRMFS